MSALGCAFEHSFGQASKLPMQRSRGMSSEMHTPWSAPLWVPWWAPWWAQASAQQWAQLPEPSWAVVSVPAPGIVCYSSSSREIVEQMSLCQNCLIREDTATLPQAREATARFQLAIKPNSIGNHDEGTLLGDGRQSGVQCRKQDAGQ